MGKKIDLTNKTFIRLFVIRKSLSKSKDGKPLWECLCKCGVITLSKTVDLTSGKKKSCGCLRHETMSNYRHGHGSIKNKSKEYRVWQGMIQRTTNKNAISYKNYGGRGIQVCDEWRDFANFLRDMGKCPSRKHSIDRVNSNGNYEPSNCKWATQIEQARNTRANHWIEHDGKRLILKEWATILHTSSTNILDHIKRGNSFDKIVTHFNKKYSKELQYNGL